jgi:uncharacterized protein (TIGR03083 family)
MSIETRLSREVYLAHLRRESDRFGQVLAGTDPRAPVPSCPGWDRDDLLWHLAEVQWFWGTVVRERVTETERAEELELDRPAGQQALWALFRQAAADLAAALESTPAQTPAWTWAREQTVGFSVRRQAHEALIHRVDAELTADPAGGARTPIDPALAADGVDEVLRLMYGDAPDWATVVPLELGRLRVTATDTGASWLVSPARFTGVSPRSGKGYDDPFLQTAEQDDGSPANASISGAAADLDCALWNRPAVAVVQRSGDEALLSAFDVVIRQGVQ